VWRAAALMPAWNPAMADVGTFAPRHRLAMCHCSVLASSFLID